MKFRKATKKDLVKIVELLADDEQGKTREICSEPLPIEYINAFVNINNDPTQELIVVENDDLEIIGSMQLSYLQYLTYRGGLRAQIEAVRVRGDKRGNGIGKMMFEWAINRAKERNAHLIQLTTDKERPAAFKFYKEIGFEDTHEGMKLHLR
ncbi:GNAT family N-acetyltransferase [uncultured Draconibacterium sp.]|uniref:GNAT family N-acetyltransferase n=1 Tax=uncultured Draconibacterium sp. TaxID=1573823 RepID=UPI002AA79B26|nr:GNAT family N-acetyltransferase [uncultured Draconibacterium sp.]